MEYTATNGAIVRIGRVNRRVLDVMTVPRPEPPMREVLTWGGQAEYVPKLNDPQYKRQLLDWRLLVFAEQWDAIAPALEVANFNAKEARALQAAGLGQGTALDWLRYGLPRADQENIVRGVFYLSTVTNLGLYEAEQRFAYTWHNQPLSAWSVRFVPGARSTLASHWRAAFRSHLSWSEFCELSGPKQSEFVAFWALEDRLTYLVQTYANANRV